MVGLKVSATQRFVDVCLIILISNWPGRYYGGSTAGGIQTSFTTGFTGPSPWWFPPCALVISPGFYCCSVVMRQVRVLIKGVYLEQAGRIKVVAR